MRGDALQQRQRVAHPVGLVSGEGGRVDGRVDVHYFLQPEREISQSLDRNRAGAGRGSDLQQSGDGAEGVPEHGGQVRHRLPLLAQLQQSVLPGLWAGQLIDPLVDLLPVHLGQRRDVGDGLEPNRSIYRIVLTSHPGVPILHQKTILLEFGSKFSKSLEKGDIIFCFPGPYCH